jgi:hypothetical protein
MTDTRKVEPSVDEAPVRTPAIRLPSTPEQSTVEGSRAGERVTPLSEFGAAEPVVRFILQRCPAPTERLLSLIREIGTGLLPSAMGSADFDVRDLTAIFATRVSGPEPVSWSSHRFGGGADSLTLHELSPDGPPGAVCYDAATGKLHVDVEALHPDGRWRLYALGRGNLLRVPHTEREVFVLSRSAPPSDPLVSPITLVSHGLLVEAWAAAANRDDWDDAALAGLLLVLFPVMRQLITEAIKAVDLVDPAHAVLLRDDLARAPARYHENLQQSLIDAYVL